MHTHAHIRHSECTTTDRPTPSSIISTGRGRGHDSNVPAKPRIRDAAPEPRAIPHPNLSHLATRARTHTHSYPRSKTRRDPPTSRMLHDDSRRLSMILTRTGPCDASGTEDRATEREPERATGSPLDYLAYPPPRRFRRFGARFKSCPI